MGISSAPQRNVTKACRTKINVDDFDRQAIRRVVHGFYERHEYPTVLSLLEELKTRQLFHGGKNALHKLLLEMGFLSTVQMTISITS